MFQKKQIGESNLWVVHLEVMYLELIQTAPDNQSEFFILCHVTVSKRSKFSYEN